MKLFKRKPKEIHKRYCTRCKTDDNLLISSRYVALEGTIVYYICRSCNAKRSNKYYHEGNQKKFIDANRRYRENLNKSKDHVRNKMSS